jgi:hypothetical protein
MQRLQLAGTRDCKNESVDIVSRASAESEWFPAELAAKQYIIRLARAAMTVAGKACAKKDAKSDMIWQPNSNSPAVESSCPGTSCMAYNEIGKSCDDCRWQRLCKEGCKE